MRRPPSPPGPGRWPTVTARRRRIPPRACLSGRFLHDRETLVQAVTELGSGYWVLTPLRTADGTLVLVNRGFVPPSARDASRAAAANRPAQVTVTGLLRMTEPGGGFLRDNDPGANRWYSRDVAGDRGGARPGPRSRPISSMPTPIGQRHRAARSAA